MNHTKIPDIDNDLFRLIRIFSQFNNSAKTQTAQLFKQRLPLVVIIAMSAIITAPIIYNTIPSFGQRPLNSLEVETITSGIQFPTGIAFLGPNDILVIEKNKGTVQRVVNGQILHEPLLDVLVANEVERGMLGIAIAKDSGNQKTYVFLYYTESKGEEGGGVVGNRLYRYELEDNKLINSKLLLDLPYLPGPAHNGGAITVGPDNNVYVIIGNLHIRAYNEGNEITVAQNIKQGEQASESRLIR